MNAAFKLNATQIEAIINKLVPLVCAPEEKGFFRGVLRIKAEESSSGAFAVFVSNLLKTAAK